VIRENQEYKVFKAIKENQEYRVSKVIREILFIQLLFQKFFEFNNKKFSYKN